MPQIEQAFTFNSTSPVSERIVSLYLDTVHNWEGTYLSMDIYNLVDQRMWITNPGLAVQAPWLVNEDDPSPDNVMTATFGLGIGGRTCLELMMDSRPSGGYRRYDTGDTIEAYQIVKSQLERDNVPKEKWDN